MLNDLDLDFDLLEQLTPLNHVISNISSNSESSVSDLQPSPKRRGLNMKRVKNYDASRLEDFLETIKQKAMSDFKLIQPKKKCPESDFHIPTYSDYSILLSYKLSKDQLRRISREYKLRVTGTNKDLLTRIYVHLKMSRVAIKIQCVFRGFLQRYCNSLRGPAFLSRSLCTNNQDFLTMESIQTIDHQQFVSYSDKDNFVYGFDVLSLYNLKQNTTRGEEVKNPYNRCEIPAQVFTDVKRLIKIMKRVYKSPLDIEIEKEDENNLSVSERITRVFMEMDSHGHYTCQSWLTNLDRSGLIRFIQELADIWFYRASLTPEIRYSISPRDPLRHYAIYINMIRLEQDLDNLREHVVHVIESMVFSGVDQSARSLGILYVLQALTLVSQSARQTMPWLYEAVAYIV